ncbi:MAG: DUF2029 domain-containing protein, partial [Frankiaceae bacterium]|nr:DUF2029 domain-containing protein [Arenimonas sp.]
MESSGQSRLLAQFTRWWAAGLALVLPVAWMVALGMDANWDLRNYHLYNPHAWLTGRAAIDIAPAQLQSWHSPLLDVPLYLITVSGADARWASAWLTLPAIVALLIVFRLQALLSPSGPAPASQVALGLLVVSGAAFGSTMGLSMNDGFVAAAMLGSLLLLVRDGDDFAGRHRWLVAGLLAGAITGLKLAAIFYCLALAAAAVVQGTSRQRLRRLLALSMGGAVGFVLTYGYWGWRLFRSHGNPFFPYFNNVFRSPDVLLQNWNDPRFRAESLLDALSSPFQLLQRTSHFSEMPIRDPRLLLGLAGLAALYVLARKQSGELRQKFAVLLCFALVAWLAWVFQYGIYRYAIVLEVLGCLALALLLQKLPRGQNIALLIALLVVSADTKRPNWGRMRSTAPSAGIVAVNIPGNSVVVIASGEPLAYMALALPGDVPIIAV